MKATNILLMMSWFCSKELQDVMCSYKLLQWCVFKIFMLISSISH